jgi:hypothetical protein
MRLRLTLLIVGATVLAAGYVAYRHRYQFEARIWHWRHGDTIVVEQYHVVVPRTWMPLTDLSDSIDVTLVDTHVERHAGLLQIADVVTLTSRGFPGRDLDRWATRKRDIIQHEALQDEEDRTVSSGDEKVVCLGGSEMSDFLHTPNSTVLTLECHSTGTLNLMFLGYRSDLPKFYSFVSQIHK